MTFVVLVNPPSREVYERVSSLVDVKGNPPPGLVLHTASETADGVQVVDVWESREAGEEFQRARLSPAMESSGVFTADSGPPPEALELEPFEVWIRGS